MAPHGSGGLGAEGGSLGNGRYVARLSEGRESSGRVTESTLLNLLFVPDGRFVTRDRVLWFEKTNTTPKMYQRENVDCQGFLDKIMLH